jgi:hypothetical protein
LIIDLIKKNIHFWVGLKKIQCVAMTLPR